MKITRKIVNEYLNEKLEANQQEHEREINLDLLNRITCTKLKIGGQGWSLERGEKISNEKMTARVDEGPEVNKSCRSLILFSPVFTKVARGLISESRAARSEHKRRNIVKHWFV